MTKIAVSPLSFGPSSDKILSGALLRSVTHSRFESVTGSQRDIDVVTDLNTAIEEILRLIPEKDRMNLLDFTMDVAWLDIGQLLYVIKRCRSLDQLLAPISHVTFSSQDFWTEIASADRIGFSEDRWFPPDETVG